MDALGADDLLRPGRLPDARRCTRSWPRRLERAPLPLVYLAVPPELFDDVIDGLAKVGLNERARLVVEKPFGRDLASSNELAAVLANAFPEERIFRIDHFLGKESVENLLVFRFANSLLEPVWNRRYVHSVQVTMAESIGHPGPGPVLRDGRRAARRRAEPPPPGRRACWPWSRRWRPTPTPCGTSGSRCCGPCAPSTRRSVVRGQYRGYRDEPGVDPHSEVETFVALRLEIDSWRWAGVPFLVRAGKCLAEHGHRVLGPVPGAAPAAVRPAATRSPTPTSWCSASAATRA